MEITDTTTLDATIDQAWALTLDIEALPSVTPTVTAVERLETGPVTVGSRARLSQPGLRPLVWTVEEVEAPHRFAWSTRLLGVRMVGVHELASLDEGSCQLTLRLQLEGRGSRVLGRLGRRSLQQTLATECAGFQRVAASSVA
ncbi:SRPBCC family protein [Nitriliruptor alkaliphilus]|uniref:SRPBCC family protein n=1 Tax=Nitriliruptor alkaliphilus TaxID=427918 RepID=UPI0006988485|nr:SRPBCC family protein [Nitriliruptor alkaliphilus]